MGNISKLLPVDWFIGLPFNDTNDPRYVLHLPVASPLTNHLY